jgi:hypothetical protein
VVPAQSYVERPPAPALGSLVRVVWAVRRLMPWRAGEIGSLSSLLAISASQLRRRCLAAVGIGPKGLQRTLRFQGFLALAQSAGVRPTPAGGGGLADLAAEAGSGLNARFAGDPRPHTGSTGCRMIVRSFSGALRRGSPR